MVFFLHSLKKDEEKEGGNCFLQLEVLFLVVISFRTIAVDSHSGFKSWAEVGISICERKEIATKHSHIYAWNSD